MCEDCLKPKEECNNCESNEIQLDANNVYFSKCEESFLPNLNIHHGTDFNTVLKKIDYKFGDNFNTVNFNAFTLNYLRIKYPTNSIKTFSESVDLELSNLKNLNTSVNSALETEIPKINLLRTDLNDIRFPRLLDSANVGFTINDNIKVVLQKVINKFNNVSSSNSNTLLVNDTNTINLVLNNSNLTANVKLSQIPNNKLEIRNGGLFVLDENTNHIQTISISGNKILLSNGGGQITLPSNNQTLSLINNKLTISNGNSVDLPSLTESNIVTNNTNSINFITSGDTNHRIEANVRISNLSNNELSIKQDGLFSETNVLRVLDKIRTDNVLRSEFCNIVSTCNNNICFKWFLRNSGTTPITVSYSDLNDVIQNFVVTENASGTISGLKVLTNPSTHLDITFLGKC